MMDDLIRAMRDNMRALLKATYDALTSVQGSAKIDSVEMEAAVEGLKTVDAYCLLYFGEVSDNLFEDDELTKPDK